MQICSLLCEADRSSASLLAHSALNNGDRLRQGRQLVLTQFAPLVPRLCLVRAHFGQHVRIGLVLEQKSRDGRQLLARRLDLRCDVGAFLLCLFHFLFGVLLRRRFLLNQLVVQVLCIYFCLFQVVSLFAEICLQALKSLNHTVRLELVHIHRYLMLLSKNRRSTPRRLQTQRICDRNRRTDGFRDGIDLREARTLSCLQRLDRIAECLKSPLQVGQIRFEYFPLLEAGLFCVIEFFLELLDQTFLVRDCLVGAIPLAGHLVNVC
mmetsp:Transcript_25344/g.72988  ORF Transcript_25344/g.72988 Transcript_25344/m.72988 type:complete len:265 (+) Transcript_25344:1232-2026(+)